MDRFEFAPPPSSRASAEPIPMLPPTMRIGALVLSARIIQGFLQGFHPLVTVPGNGCTISDKISSRLGKARDTLAGHGWGM